MTKFSELYSRVLEREEKFQPHDPEMEEMSKIGMGEVYPEDNEETSPSNTHLYRAYHAIKGNEWSFKDFEDFIATVRNEAKIS
jgi:hypothetical protein